MYTSRRPQTSAPLARVRRNFWLLVGIAIVATGFLFDALRSTPGPLTGAAVAVSGVVAVTTLALAARILVVLSPTRQLRQPRRSRIR